MKEEISAGGIVFNREGSTVLILISQHSGHHGWVFPKGHVGDKIAKETYEEAALREVREETGVTGIILDKLSPIDYWFEAQGKKRHKTVLYFLMEYTEGNIENHDWEMEKVEWLSLSQVSDRLTYPGDKRVWEEAKGKIEKLMKDRESVLASE